MMTALLLTMAVSLSLTPHPPAGFTLVASRANVTVYRHPEGPGVELYAEGDIAAPPSQVLAVLLAYERHPQFVKDVAESRVLRREPAALWVYQRLDLPVLADRDYTLRVTWGQEGNVLWTHFVCDNEQGPPPRRGVVRISLHEGRWLLEPIDGGKATHARYQVRLDLAGSLPGWMARGQAAKEVPALFEGIRHQIP
jgi:hypothetical protein